MIKFFSSCIVLLCVLATCTRSTLSLPVLSSDDIKQIYDTAQAIKTALHKIHPMGNHVFSTQLTRGDCDALRQSAEYSCAASFCYAMVDCPSTITMIGAFSFDNATNAQVQNLCEGNCFSRIMFEMKKILSSPCLQLNNGIVTSALIDAYGKFMCAQHPDNEYCVIKLKRISNDDQSLKNSSINTLNSSLPACIAINSMGCCFTSMLDLASSVSGYASLRTEMNTILTRCSIPTPPACVGTAGSGTKEVVQSKFRINGISYTKYQALSTNSKYLVQLRIRQDIAGWLVARGLSWLTYQNVFISSFSGTDAYLIVNFQVFGASDMQTQQANTAIRLGLVAAQTNPANGPSFTTATSSADIVTSPSATVSVDPSASSSSTITLGTYDASAASSNVNLSLVSILLVAFVTMFLL